MSKRQLAPAIGTSEQQYWRRKPVLFAKEYLSVNPWKKQQEILSAISNHNRVAVRSCNGSGKTFTAALATIWWLMTHDEAIVITTAPTERQVQNLLWREIRGIYLKNGDLIGGKITSTRLELSSNRYAFGFSTNTTERFQGFHNENLLIIVDEASGVKEPIFDAIRSCLTTANAKLLMIGNPQNLSGTFYDAFHKTRSQWETIHISAFDTPIFTREIAAHEPPPPGILTKEWVDEIAGFAGEENSRYQIHVLGEFPSQADDTLIPLKWIEQAADRHFDPDDEHDTVMGLDVARFGDAKTVAIVRRGAAVVEMREFPSAELMETTGRAQELATEHDVKTIFVDQVGIGAGVEDRLKELGITRVVGVNAGLKASNSERFSNLRAEMFHGLRQRFADDDIAIPNDPELISQLASLTYTYTSRGQLQMQSKEQIRNSGLPSPDKADALTLAFTAPEPPPEPELFAFPLTREGVESYRRRFGKSSNH
ncbi:MAG: AAA family ATPase [Chloroflexi bacterium]|nr:AAA family ATPase [Chloroflexota bacterium]